MISTEWISVNDRLPDDMESVLVCDMNPIAPFVSIVDIAFFADGVWQMWDGRYEPYEIVTVSHWMPLPELPVTL
jgi:hypothetical protein